MQSTLHYHVLESRAILLPRMQIRSHPDHFHANTIAVTLTLILDLVCRDVEVTFLGLVSQKRCYLDPLCTFPMRETRSARA